MFKKPAGIESSGKQSQFSYDFGTWAKACQNLCEFLTLTQSETGEPRETGTLLIVAEGGLWKGSLHDRDSQRSCWLSGRTPTELMAALERVCATGDADWRHKPPPTVPGRGRR